MPSCGRAAAEDVLDHDHALRPAETAEGGVGLPVGLGDSPVHVDVRDPVGVVDVAQRPGQHRLGQVDAPAAVAGQGRAQGDDLLVLVEAGLPGGQERVPLAGHRDVLSPVEPQRNRPSGEGRAQRGDGRQAVRLELLAAEAAAHPQALHRDLAWRCRPMTWATMSCVSDGCWVLDWMKIWPFSSTRASAALVSR